MSSRTIPQTNCSVLTATGGERPDAVGMSFVGMERNAIGYAIEPDLACGRPSSEKLAGGMERYREDGSEGTGKNHILERGARKVDRGQMRIL